ncbi:DUF4160 domain-containing protein [Halomonas binhaiensis]|uniref:DUF4160 domain-containing protein n=1 Tax=Halomonas binhaiensis TaxID=2562282 RepID=A0A5C1NLP4_9GAMM|nr:DUF4160 domain-containing protein [Halomonas binhaiensis]QEM83318.1 DUF4160 domain-containing protein [Halomonas binhaiensis]
MPTVLRQNGFRFYFYSHEPDEPPHVHVDYSSASAKIWLHDITIARNIGFSAKEVGKIQRIVREHQETLQEAWHAFFGI